jgi:hypothetical protein
MKCPNCGNEIVPVYSWIEHPGPGRKMIGHPGPLSHYECEQCGTKKQDSKNPKQTTDPFGSKEDELK